MIEEEVEAVLSRLACVARGPTGFVLFTHFRRHRLLAVQAWSVGNFEEVPVGAAPKR